MAEANPTKRRERTAYNHANYLVNKEKVAARSRRWRENNKEKHNEKVRDWQKRNPEKVKLGKRKAVLKSQYGLSLEDFDSMAAAQGFACAICKKVSEKTLHIDHDHKTDRIRGLLCSPCNTALGLLKDNTEFLARAINYLSI